MRRCHIRLCACLAGAIAAALLLSSCFTTAKEVSVADLEREILTLVNQERQQAGLAPLRWGQALADIAAQYSTSGFSERVEAATHLRFLLSNSWRSVYKRGSPLLVQDTAREQVDFCLESPNLSQAVFRADARETGVSVAIIGDTVYYTQVFDLLNVARTSGEPLALVENALAQDPTWSQLQQFVLNDDTDDHSYMPASFMCTEFAAMLHDRAEAAGIRAAYVSVDFAGEPSHALNAFMTVDHGLVYVDCTGPGLNAPRPAGIDSSEDQLPTYDKVAYLATGSEYGLISIDQAASFTYDFYDAWQLTWAEYIADRDLHLQKTEAYNEALGGRTVITDPEEYDMLQAMLTEIQALEQDLEAEKAVLGEYRWEPLGIVAEFYVHW